MCQIYEQELSFHQDEHSVSSNSLVNAGVDGTTSGMRFAFALDHLVVAARSLNEGASYVEAILGAKLSAGGKHPRMGTHNRLLSLGQGNYLEVIAVDPNADKPAYRRWYNLDNFSGQPRVVNWACRTDDLETALEAAPPGSGKPMQIRRGDLSWQMAVPEFGRLPYDDAMPALIEWYTDMPQTKLPDHGFRLSRLDVFHPDAEGLLAAFPVLSCLQGLVSVLDGPEKRLIATISTPEGDRILT